MDNFEEFKASLNKYEKDYFLFTFKKETKVKSFIYEEFYKWLLNLWETKPIKW